MLVFKSCLSYGHVYECLFHSVFFLFVFNNMVLSMLFLRGDYTSRLGIFVL